MKTLGIALILLVGIAGGAWAGTSLTFEERVKAQKAIERVFYEHRLWPKENPRQKPPFEQMVSKEILRNKAETYLLKSAALDQFWQTPLTGEQLQAELNRMISSSKDPQTLEELFESLNHDAFQAAECLARPILADRLIRNYYAMDGRWHGAVRQEAENLRGQLTVQNFRTLGGDRYFPVHLTAESVKTEEEGAPSLSREELAEKIKGFPAAGAVSRVIETEDSFFIRMTESVTGTEYEGGLIRFQKRDISDWLENEARTLLSTDIVIPNFEYSLETSRKSSLRSADPISPDSWKIIWDVPEKRVRHTAVWTGYEMIVWGGQSTWATTPVYFNQGGRYNPTLDYWVPISINSAPSARSCHTAVWTGKEMIIWGGYNGSALGDGGRYNPDLDNGNATDTPWQATTSSGVPTARYYHTAVWTGEQMIVWGGYDGAAYLDTGSRYFPVSDQWSFTGYTNRPSIRKDHTAVWTGEVMIIWGGYNGTTYLNTGAMYFPRTNTWTTLAATTLAGRSNHTAVWCGKFMIIWGGEISEFAGTNDGSMYNPNTNAWTAVSATSAPTARSFHSAVWSGEQMILWGGSSDTGHSTSLQTGARFTPSDTGGGWAVTSPTFAPASRFLHTAVWTGNEMVMWGGVNCDAGQTVMNTGSRYRPTNDSWLTLAVANSPDARYYHTAVWTGTEMVVWGGYNGNVDINTGGMYYPSLDSWTNTSSTSAPTIRREHAAVWTGASVIEWGGYFTITDTYANTGGLLDPVTNSWTATGTGANVPLPRARLQAVWSGTEMLIWGGYGCTFSNCVGGQSYPNNGARYNPSGSGAWTAMNPTGAPAARRSYTAVWDGDEMIVWGGYNGSYLNTGGIYKPADNTWRATSATGAPTARYYHTAVWADDKMLVWGGIQTGSVLANDGKRFDSSNGTNGTWTAMSASPLSARDLHSAVWTGTEMIFWAGWNGASRVNDGARYIPTSDTWSIKGISNNPPSARARSAAVWTGREMIVWDGEPQYQNGGAFYPNSDPIARPFMTIGNYDAAGSSLTAAYDSSHYTPFCSSVGSSCASSTLLIGRDTIMSGAEPNQPNTLGSTCADGPSGMYQLEPSLESLTVTSPDGKEFWPGRDVTVNATAWVSEPTQDRLDLYYRENRLDAANQWGVDWRYLTTLVPTASGSQSFSATFHLRAGIDQGIRGVFRFLGSPKKCGVGPFDDNDDLFFTVRDVTDTLTYTLGYGQTLTLIGSGSYDGSIKRVDEPYHDTMDGIALYEWDLTGDTSDSATCAAADSTKFERTGEVVHLTDADLSGLLAPGPHSVWLRVTDKAGAKNCGSMTLTIHDSIPPTTTLVTPNGGESWTYSESVTSRQSHRVYWEASDNNNSLTRTRLWYSSTYGTGLETAVYDPTLKVPKCTNAGKECDSGGLLNSRDTITGTQESNQPNTLGGSCADGTVGTYHSDASIDRIRIYTADGSPLVQGGAATLEVTYWAATSQARTAIYDNYFSVPRCHSACSSCDSGALLNGRDNVSGIIETHQPNTIYGTCADAAGTVQHESIERIVIHTQDGSMLAPGKTVQVDVTANIVVTASDRIDLYRANDAFTPSWTFLTTLIPAATGIQTLSTTYALPAGSLQAIRAQIRYGGVLSICSSGSYDDHDDLIFPVGISERLDVYSAANASSPSWSAVATTVMPPATGLNVYSTSFTLPSGGLQAVRAQLRSTIGGGNCETGGTNDHDDLAFAAGSLWTCIADSNDGAGGAICPVNGLASGVTNYLWTMPTQAEAALAGQTFPTATARMKVEVWDSSGNTASDISDANFYIIQPTTTAIKTLILWNSARIELKYPGQSAALGLKLAELADHSKMSGVVLDLNSVSTVATAYANWDSSPTNQGLANAVASAIWTYLKAQIDSAYTNTQYIQLVGDDFQIPFYRITDGTVHGEGNYPAEGGLNTSTTVGSALNQSYFLTDNFYGEYDPEDSGILSPPDNASAYLEDFAVGRLVETPGQITGVINTFLAQDGQINFTSTSDKVLVAGWDFMYDSGLAVRNQYAVVPRATDCLLDDPTASGSLDCSNPVPDKLFTPADLSTQIFSSPLHKIGNVNTHALHYAFQASTDIGGNGKPLLCTDPTYATACHATGMDGQGALTASVFYTPGCHAGLNIPDYGPDTKPLDLPEEMAKKGVLTYLANTGYGWGMDVGTGLSEVLMLNLTTELLTNDSISVGKAMANAKRTYYMQEKRWDVFDEKVAHELTLYGIPNTLIVGKATLRADGADGLPTPDGPDKGCDHGICLDKSLKAGSNGLLPSGVTELDLNFTFGSGTYQLFNTSNGSYYKLNGRASGEVGETIQPHFVYNSYLSGTNAHGILFTGGIYTSESPFNPVIATPASTSYDPTGEGDLSPGGNTWAPGLRASFGTSGGLGLRAIGQVGYTNLTVHTGFFESVSSGTESKFGDMQFIQYYSTAADVTSPAVTDPGSGGFHSLNGLTATFTASVSDASGVYRVLVTYNDRVFSQWKSLDLAYVSGNTWSGSLALKGSIDYYVQAIDVNGNVGILTESGPDLDPNHTPYGSTWSGPKLFSITLADSDADSLPDAYEDLHTACLNKSTPGQGALDPDYDYLTSYQEFINGTDPCKGDSDGGGDNDGSEKNHARNPLVGSDDKHLTIFVNKVGSDYQITWPGGSGDNSSIDGYYFVYRSALPSFTPADKITTSPYPLPTGTAAYTDSSNPPCNPCFYNVWNILLDTQPPTVQAAVPNSGPSSGGTSVNVFGQNFLSGAKVYFDTAPATNVVFVSTNMLTCTTPAHAAGLVTVKVSNPNAQEGSLPSGFTYTP